MIQNQEFIQEFVDEAKSHLEKVEAALLNKNSLSQDREMINDVFRAVHSIKGTAGFFGLKKIVALAHAMENVFGEIRSGRLTITEAMEETLLTANDGIKDLVDNVLMSEERDVAGLVSRVNALLEIKPGEPKAISTPDTIVITDENRKNLVFNYTENDLLVEGLRHGHRIYEVKLKIIKDLINYAEGPVKLFKKIEAVGTVVDTLTDHTDINSLEDVLIAVSEQTKDVYLGILVTTVLERELFAEALGIPVDKINPLQINVIKESRQPTEGSDTETIDIAQPEPKVDEGQPTSDLPPTVETVQKQAKFDDSIRVNVSILNDLLDMAGEMVLGRNQLLSTLENYRKTIPGLAPILQNVDRLTTAVQEKIMLTRMQPVGNVFNKFPRIIRDISKTLSKEIELVLEGESVELDKSMIEALTDPLTHLVRNAADHGLETAEVRQKNGKPAIGKIILRAYHEGGYVNIDIIDDGAGMDVEKVKKAALAKEIISFNELEKLSEADALKLILKPGFSTAEKISDLSGRGVGMDVVKTNIEKLGGSIEIYTVKGKGTTIRLMLPLTLAIIQSLIVEAEGNRFALPQVNLKEIVRIKVGDTVNRIERLHDAEVLRLRGRLLPIIHLADVLKLPHAAKIGNRGEQVDDRDDLLDVTRVLVLKIGNRMFGLVVDAIFGREETLVKPLPVYLKDCSCYSGVTILGDGKTAMILDPEGIIRLTDLKFSEDHEQLSQTNSATEIEMTEVQNLLLFKCSGDESFGLDLSVVSRIEEIQAKEIDQVGEKEFITFNHNSLRVIRLEDYLPVNRRTTNPDKYYVIIPKLVAHPIGILIEKIYDNIQTAITLNTEGMQCEGLIGTTIYNNRMVLLVNIYELFEKVDPEHYQINRKPITDHREVLLVEDTQSFQRIVTKYLENAGYRVVLAQNGREALEYLANHHFDIVVSDIHMPVMDGLEFIKKLREDPAHHGLPAVALTSMSDELTKAMVFEYGFDFYEWKLDRDSLLKTMEFAFQNRGRDKND